jgi:predicted HicB family RNase H-like nuclease
MMKYKGYTGYVEFDPDADVFHGEVVDTRDVITFQGKTVRELKKAFRDSVDDYLEYCEERGEEPDRPFSGKFVLRLSPELHHRAYLRALESGKSLNVWVTEVLEEAV